MKVLFQYQGLMSEQYMQFFRSNLGNDIELIFSDQTNPDEIAQREDISEIEVFVGYTVSSALMKAATSLRHIQIPWTGFDRMDTSLIDTSKITVSNSHANSTAIAEHAVALMLAASKLLILRDGKMRQGDWSTRSENVDSFWVTGKTLGIVGYGAIGEKVANMLSGFGMRTIGVRRHPEDNPNAEYIVGTDRLDQVLSESDYLLVAVPLTDETRGMLGPNQLDLLKPECVIVNIARGPVIDEEALYTRLRDKKIGAAGIDVWYNYPSRGESTTMQNFPFEELDNIVMTPHSAFKIRDRVEEFAKDILKNIELCASGQSPINQVYLDLGY